jgi:hypothetical protein
LFRLFTLHVSNIIIFVVRTGESGWTVYNGQVFHSPDRLSTAAYTLRQPYW